MKKTLGREAWDEEDNGVLLKHKQKWLDACTPTHTPTQSTYQKDAMAELNGKGVWQVACGTARRVFASNDDARLLVLPASVGQASCRAGGWQSCPGCSYVDVHLAGGDARPTVSM